MSTSANPLRTDERRRSQRIPFSVPIEVEGKTADGKPFHEKTYTLEINRHGALIVLQSRPQPGGRVTISNLQTKSKCPFQVVSRPGKPLDKDRGAEWGVESLDPGINFWGLSFPDKQEVPNGRTEIDVLLECSKCHSREPANVTLSQYQTLSAQSSLRRSCLQCETMTEWSVVHPNPATQGGSVLHLPTAAPVTPPPQGRPPREERRLFMRLPVRIRLEDIGQTENLSPSGLCFSSGLTMSTGDRVWLTVGYGPGGNEKEVAARVMWREELAGGKRALYGVQLEHDK